MKTFRQSHYLAPLLLLFFCIPTVIFAAVMQSGNYRIQSDSVNTAGGGADSASYHLEDTTGEIATGVSSSGSYMMNAGFQQMQGNYIAISSVGPTSLPDITTLFSGVSTGSMSWTVTTDSPAGYSLAVKAATAPALKSPLGSFADYAPGGTPSFDFTVAAPDSSFGFSPEGADITSTYKDNGSACNTGALDTADKCWEGFSTTDKVVSQSATSNHPSGTATTLKVRAEVGSAKIQESGSYTATLTLTATAL
jgi:hypothetical protein